LFGELTDLNYREIIQDYVEKEVIGWKLNQTTYIVGTATNLLNLFQIRVLIW
jgi:hypothetical protein